MGTFAHYEGNMNIPEEKRDMFIKHMLKVLNYGGMLQFDSVKVYGKKIVLINPPEPDENGMVEFHYNYFEDDMWESAYFNTKTTKLSSGKIGSNEFNWAIKAAYSLYEVYDEGVGTVMQDGKAIKNGYYYLGWLNYILGTHFTIRNRFRIWEYFEMQGISNYNEGYDYDIKLSDILQRVPSKLFDGFCGMEMIDICNVLGGTATLKEDELTEGTYYEAIFKVKVLLKKYYDNKVENEKKLENLWKLLKMDKEKRKAIEKIELVEIAKLTLNVPARVFVYLSSELLEKNFWKIWADLEKDVYHDEDSSIYTTEEEVKAIETVRNTVMSEVKTEDFFYKDGYFAFRGTPEELEGTPNYYISKDELAYWWDGEEDFFSETMQKWLEELSVRHKKLTEEIDLSNLKREDFFKNMIETLYEVNQYYKRVFAYRDMFYEFLLNADNKNVHAAIMLLKELSDENKEDGKIIEKVGGYWELTSKNVTFNIGRRRMKRYLAVMGNKKLREKYFGF